MKPTHIEHIGIAVANLEESIGYYEKVLGLECYAIEEVADQQVRTAFFKVGDTKVKIDIAEVRVNPEGLFPIGNHLVTPLICMITSDFKCTIPYIES